MWIEILPPVTPGPVMMLRSPFSARILRMLGRYASSASRVMSLPLGSAAWDSGVGAATHRAMASAIAPGHGERCLRATLFSFRGTVKDHALSATVEHDLVGTDADDAEVGDQ